MTTAAVGRRAARRPRRLLNRKSLLVVIAALALAWATVHAVMPSWYARMWYPLDYAQAIQREAAVHGMPPELVAAVIKQESGFDASARSGQGAVGLMQVMPATAEWISHQRGAPAAAASRLGDPEVNIAYGAWYLHYLLAKYGDTRVALAAYNGGETNAAKWARDAGADGRRLSVGEIPFPETRQFVKAVSEGEAIYRRAYGAELGLD